MFHAVTGHDDPLRELSDKVWHLKKAEDDLRLHVERLRLQGYSWADIGIGLGITRQGAYARFGRK